MADDYIRIFGLKTPCMHNIMYFYLRAATGRSSSSALKMERSNLNLVVNISEYPQNLAVQWGRSACGTGCDHVTMAIRPATILPFLRGARPYSLYVLFVLVLVYTLNQADRFLLSVTGTKIVRDLRFGQFKCQPNTSHSLPDNVSCVGACVGIAHEEK